MLRNILYLLKALPLHLFTHYVKLLLLLLLLNLRAVLLVYQGTMRFQAGIAQPPLGPDAADRLDTLAAVPGVVACGVTVALEPQRRVAAVKEELLQVAHADGYRWF